MKIQKPWLKVLLITSLIIFKNIIFTKSQKIATMQGFSAINTYNIKVLVIRKFKVRKKM